jgi:nucleoside-diphosphate-sugar epimerase
VCVTGGAGFIGSHLCHALVDLGATVVALDDLSQGREANLEHLGDRVRLVRGSILDDGALTAALGPSPAEGGAEVLFHLAAITSVPRSIEEPRRCLEVNALGTARVLEAARAGEVGRVVYASSSSAYGDQGEGPKVETMRPDPRSPYAASKCAGEHMLQAHARCFGASCLSLRYFNVFGPRQRADSPYAAVIPRFIEAMRRGRAVVVYGDGAQTRDFTHVANAVRANLLAGAAERVFTGEVVNVACGRAHSVLDLIDLLADRLGVEAIRRHAEPRAGEVRHSLASIEAARTLLGYEPVVSIETGLDRTIASIVKGDLGTTG